MSQPNNSLGSDNPPIEDKKLSTEDAIEFLGSEDNDDEESETIELEKDSRKDGKVPEKGKEKDKEPGEEEEDSDGEKSLEDELEKELEDDLEEPDEDELELIAPVRRKEILAKYPTIFKEFPALEKAYYREQKYAELLPTIEDAKTAVERSEILDEFEADLTSGSTENILKAVKDNDNNAFVKIVDNYLPALHKVDEGAYYHIIGNIVKHTIIQMVSDGKSAESQELIDAARIVNEYVFGTKQFTHPTRLSKESDKPEDNQKEVELQEREQEIVERQFNSAKDDVITKLDKTISGTVDKYIDPRGSMSPYVKKNAVREVNDLLEKSISEDKRFMDVYDRLWERATQNNFNAESMDRIRTAYLSKAKTQLPAIIKSVRNEALRASGKRDNDEKDKKGPLPVGKTRGSAPSSKSTKPSEQAKGIPRGMSSLDYLNSD